jgi:hypothetical protein
MPGCTMPKIYRVTSTFSAKQLYREPLHYGVFHPGDMLVGLRIVRDQIEFCLRDKLSDQGGKLEYTISEADFLRDTAEHFA